MSFQFRLSRLAERTERPGDDLVAVGVVERDRVRHITVALESQELFPRIGVPHLERKREQEHVRRFHHPNGVAPTLQVRS